MVRLLSSSLSFKGREFETMVASIRRITPWVSSSHHRSLLLRKRHQQKRVSTLILPSPQYLTFCKSCPRRRVASVWTKHSVTTLLPSIRVYVGPSLSIVCKSCPRRRRASVWTKHSVATLLPIIRVYVGPLYYYLPYVPT